MHEWIYTSQSQASEKPLFGYLSIIGGFLVQLTLGAIYTFGNMAPYMVTYMKNHTHPINEITVGKSVWIFGLAVFALGASMSLGGFFVPRVGSKLTILMGGWIMSLSIIATYWTIKTHLALVSITYGLIAGFGAGIAYGTIISIPSEWFPNHKGLVTGIVVAGFGLSPVTMDFIQTYYINPNILAVNITNVTKVPPSFILMGCIYGIMQLIGSLMIKRPKISDETVSINETDFVTESFNSVFSKLQTPVKPQKMIFEKDFWILWITYTMNSVVIILILSLHKVFGEKLCISDIFLTAFSAVGAICNGLGRIVWGFLIDKFAYKKLMTLLTVFMSIMMGTFYLTSLVGDLKVKNEAGRTVMYVIWVMVLHFLLSGNFSLYPVICTQRFGNEYSHVNHGILFTAYALGGIIASGTTTSMLSNETNCNEYLAPFLIGSGLSLLSAIFNLMYQAQSFIIIEWNKSEMQ